MKTRLINSTINEKEMKDKNSLEGSQRTCPPATTSIGNDDERLLARIGYQQELNRQFTKWSVAAGGPATAVWAWFIGSAMAMCTASSAVAELVSAYPTAGGMYFITKQVVPKEHVAIWAWIIGWCNLLASLAYTVAQMIFAATVMKSPYPYAAHTFSPCPYQIFLLAILILCLFGIICSLPTKNLHRIVVWFAPVNILASFAICVALLLLTPDKQSARWVFTEITDGSGWGSKGLSFLLGFLSVAWTMTNYDGTTHMSEETHDPATRGPAAIRSAVLVSAFVGWMLTITFSFCLTDPDEIMASPTGLPVAQIFLNAGGRAGGTVMWLFIILVQFFTGCSAMLANARMAYAFARDGALPFSGFWNKINVHTQTPVNAVWLIVIFCSCLDIIGIGSTQTVIAIFNITAPALDLSYIAVIIAHRIYENRVTFTEGPYSLGRWSKSVNAICVVWVCFISIILFLPPIKPVSATNMNYAICVALLIALVSLTWWFVSARHKYTGPRIKEMGIVPT